MDSVAEIYESTMGAVERGLDSFHDWRERHPYAATVMETAAVFAGRQVLRSSSEALAISLGTGGHRQGRASSLEVQLSALLRLWSLLRWQKSFCLGGSHTSDSLMTRLALGIIE